jgi:hypothetical protein
MPQPANGAPAGAYAPPGRIVTPPPAPLVAPVPPAAQPPVMQPPAPQPPVVQRQPEQPRRWQRIERDEDGRDAFENRRQRPQPPVTMAAPMVQAAPAPQPVAPQMPPQIAPPPRPSMPPPQAIAPPPPRAMPAPEPSAAEVRPRGEQRAHTDHKGTRHQDN